MAEPLTLERLQRYLDNSPFIAFMRMRAKAVEPEKETVILEMPMRPEFERGKGTGQYHGGVIATFIDVAGDFAVALVVGGPVPTINLRVDYLRPATQTNLTATARVRRAGRTVGVVDIDVHDDNGKLVAVGRGTYSATPG
ncbi:MAG TPA: PaaI family thioesterase [Stellaceae bacterium]|nr:PaaI family thioesterase [Stellaceae bacterium]